MWQETILTDINGRDTVQAIRDLEAHNLPHLFSHRQCYFVGCETQAQVTWKAREPEIKQAYRAGIEKVMKWCEQYAEYWESITKPSIHIPDDQWQAFKEQELKE